MTDKYIPQEGDVVKWPHHRVGWGSIKGKVDYIESMTNETAMVYIPPSSAQQGENGQRRTRFRKRFDQLTLVERPGVDT